MRAIESAFAEVPVPAEPDLLAADGCHCMECQWTVAGLIGRDWLLLTVEDCRSDQLDSIIPNISPSAFRFFLPGLMRLSLQPDYDGGEMIGSDIINMLTCGNGDTCLDRDLPAVQRRLELLSLDQREVIATYLGYLERMDWGHSPVVLRSARQNVVSGQATPYSHRALVEELRVLYKYTG